MDDSATPTPWLLSDRYELKERIGRGSITEVFRATDRTERRTVAVKLLRRHLAAAATVHDRFLRQAYRASRLKHDRIISIYDVGTEQGHTYIVQEYLPGGSLAAYIEREAPIEVNRALKLIHDIATGVGHAHSQGLTHGRLSPSAILLTAGRRPKVGDFGLIDATTGERGRDRQAVTGSAAYLAPEQLTGEPATAESDVYALGVILYELLTGGVPDAATPARPGTTWDFPAAVTPAIQRLVLVAGAADPADRYVDGIELAEDIAETRRTQRSAARRMPAPRPKPEEDNEPPVRTPPPPDDEPPMPPQPPVTLPNPGSAAGSGVPGAVVVALVFCALMAVLAGVGLSFFRSLDPTPLASVPFERPTPALPTVAAPTATPPAQSSPAPSPTPSLTGNEALVPQLVGYNLEQAEPWLRELNLPHTIKEEHSDQYEIGEIISQFPLALQPLRQGEQVELVVSLGPSERVVPSVTGMPVADAEQALQALGLKVEIQQAASDTVAAGVVLSQAPAGDAPIPAESVVLLVVSQGAGQITVPNLIGRNIHEAGAALGRLGLGAQPVNQPDNAHPPGTVISQFPPGGSAVPQGTAVTLAVAVQSQ